jgi:hypothetical protein
VPQLTGTWFPPSNLEVACEWLDITVVDRENNTPQRTAITTVTERTSRKVIEAWFAKHPYPGSSVCGPTA